MFGVIKKGILMAVSFFGSSFLFKNRFMEVLKMESRKMIEKTNDKKSEKIRLARNKYAREWRAKNKDKVKQYNEKFFAKFLDE
jgi:hypothetical protein